MVLPVDDLIRYILLKRSSFIVKMKNTEEIQNVCPLLLTYDPFWFLKLWSREFNAVKVGEHTLCYFERCTGC